MRVGAWLAVLTAICVGTKGIAHPPQAAADALMATDRAYSQAAARSQNPAEGLAAMFDDEVVFPLPGTGLLSGRERVLEFFQGHPSYQSGTVSWTPIRSGISADGTHGFTFGFLDVTEGPPARRPRKYLSYWIRRPDGWRVIAYRQISRPAGEVSRIPMAPSLPSAPVTRASDPRHNARDARSLAAAELAFSNRAQRVGRRIAFREVVSSDGILLGESPAFLIGPEQVISIFPQGERTSPLRWASDRVIVAPSGDLGLSIGTLRYNGPPPEGEAATFPYFTIWRRNGRNAPWRFIAE